MRKFILAGAIVAATGMGLGVALSPTGAEVFTGSGRLDTAW